MTSDRFGVELIEVLACDIDARPRTAPTIFDLAAHIVRAERAAGSLRVAFASEAAGEVEAFVDAERLCCGGIEWRLEDSAEGVVLTIGATPAQLDAMERMFGRA
jgi:hypothetical protein